MLPAALFANFHCSRHWSSNSFWCVKTKFYSISQWELVTEPNCFVVIACISSEDNHTINFSKVGTFWHWKLWTWSKHISVTQSSVLAMYSGFYLPFLTASKNFMPSKIKYFQISVLLGFLIPATHFHIKLLKWRM